MSHAELDGAMLLNTVPGKSYEYFGYVRVAGIDYKFYAYPDTRRVELAWTLKLRQAVTEQAPASSAVGRNRA